ASIDASGTVTGGSAGNATITYTNGGCFDTAIVVIAPLPGAVARPLSDTMLCPGGRVSFIAGTSSGTTYQWLSGGTPISGATTAFYTATTAAFYSVRITDIYGCTSYSSSVDVTVNPVAATITAAGSTSFCAGSNVVLNANTGFGLSYQWLRNGVAISGATGASYTATLAGNYTVMEMNIAGCSDISSAITVTVLASPGGTVTASGALTFCAGNSVRLTADSVAGITWQWQNGATNIPGATNRTYTATASGNYRVVENNGICGATSTLFTVTVLPLPVPTVTVTGAPVFCTGGSVTLSGPSVSGYTYQWYNAGVAIAGATGVNYVTSVAGTFGVTVTDAAGCSGNTAAPVTVTEVGMPVATASPRPAICQGGTTILTARLTGTTATSYQWQLGGVDIAGATNATYVASAAGLYSFVAVGVTGCTMLSGYLNVTLSPVPAPVVSYSGGRLSTSRGFASYQWYKNNVLLFGAISYTYTPTDTGRYFVKVIDSGGCEGTSLVYVITNLATSVGTITTADVTVYPNPATGLLHIVAPAGVGIRLQTLAGQTLLQRSEPGDVEMSDLPAGLYLLQITDSEGRLLRVEKIVKQ
ncbi:MAG: T9SS C-terminal target domain-containing protein, partial [Chitinophagia bacterium]|nr:T9SS C-terminal target domain-containing protein [Chitinophagia bacterium]